MLPKSRLLLVSAIVILLVACDFLQETDGLATQKLRTSEGAYFAAQEKNRGGSGRGGLTVMTRNLYIGADVARVVSAESPAQIPLLATQVFQTLVASNFPERAQAIAGEIAITQPHLVGVQEAFVIRVQSPGDAVVGGVIPAEDVVLDYTQILLEALGDHGLDYRVVGSVQNSDIELPMLAGTNPLLFNDVRATDFAVVLARHDVDVARVVEANFQAQLTVPGVGITIPRGYVAVDATVYDRTYRFVNTHLEPFSLTVQVAQAQELLAVLAEEELPVALVGDFNTPAPNGDTYEMLLSAGYVDVWTLNQRPHSGDGFTCCQAENLRHAVSLLDRRVDLIFFKSNEQQHGRAGLGAVFAAVLGDEPQDRTPSGLWPSDHAGVVATLRIPGSVAHQSAEPLEEIEE